MEPEFEQIGHHPGRMGGFAAPKGVPAMNEISLHFPDAFPIRSEHAASIERSWARTAAAGAWFSGEERVAIANETRLARDCALCAERKAALSPYAVEGEHEANGPLSAAIVDLVHRVTSDPGRLSKRLYEDAREAGLSASQYCEIVGVVVRTINTDMFCKAAGLPEFALPAPAGGAPTRNAPGDLAEGEAWVPMLPNRHDEFDGRSLPNVGRALSAAPEEVRAMADLAEGAYLPIEGVADPTADPGRAIDRAQMELIAGRISALNECFY